MLKKLWLAPVIMVLALGACSKKNDKKPATLRVTKSSHSPTGPVIAGPNAITPPAATPVEKDENASPRSYVLANLQFVQPNVASTVDASRADFLIRVTLNDSLSQALEGILWEGARNFCVQKLRHNEGILAGKEVLELSYAQDCLTTAAVSTNKVEVTVLEIADGNVLKAVNGTQTEVGRLDAEGDLISLCSDEFESSCHYLSDMDGNFVGITADK